MKNIVKVLIILAGYLISYNCNAFELQLIRDAETESVLKQILKPILLENQIYPSSISINIINSDDPNAFVMQGQNIFISTGLISFSQNLDAVTGVLAHEVGHIKGGHLVQQAIELKNIHFKTVIGMLAGVALGAAAKSSDVAVATVMASQDIGHKTYLTFTRTQENAADMVSVRTLRKLGINGGELVKFLQSLNTAEKSFYQNISEYDRTHPLTANRIEFIKSNISGVQSGNIISQKTRNQFKLVNAKIFAFTNLPDDTFRKFDNGDHEALYAKSIAYFKQQKIDLAIQQIDFLINVQPSYPYFHELKGQILFESGSILKAIEAYKAAFQLIKDQAGNELIKVEYANVLIANKTDIKLALHLLNQIISSDSNNAYMWQILARGYDLVGDQNNMRISLAHYNYIIGDIDTATKNINAVNVKSLKPEALVRYQDVKNMIELSKTED